MEKWGYEKKFSCAVTAAAGTLGIIIPPIRIRDNIQLKPNEYRIKIRTILVGSGDLMSGAYLAMNPGDRARWLSSVA